MNWACPACGTRNEGSGPCLVCGTARTDTTTARADPTDAVPVFGVVHHAPPSTSASPAPAPSPTGPHQGARGTDPPKRPTAGRPPLVAGAVIAAVAIIAAVGAIVAVGQRGHARDRSAPATVVTAAAPGAAARGDAGTTGPGSSPTTAQPTEVALAPTAAHASAQRSDATLKCTGEHVDYGPERLIDGDPQTGWGAGEDDGTGQTIEVDFGREVHLTSIALTPGFVKVGPRADRGCASTSAFPLNRFVASVSYRFDDGSEVVAHFQQTPDAQTQTVDVDTSTVTMTILETQLPPGADDDTVLSELTFRGWDR